MELKLPLLVVFLLSLAPALRAAELPKHPFVIVNAKELAELRAELARPGWKADLYHGSGGADRISEGRGLRANADYWLKQRIVIPGYGGRGHNFFCDDGTRLAVSPQYPFRPGPYTCPSCGKSYTGERYEAGLKLEIHRLLCQAALDMALVSAIERKPDYARKSAEILLKYADAYPGPHTSHTAGGLMTQSLDEAIWVIRLAQAYDLVYDSLDAQQRAKIERFLHTVAEGQQHCGARTNWGSWHLSAVGVIGYAIHDQALVDWALTEFRRQVREELGDDNIWPECVHTYHFFVLHAYVSLAEAARHAGVDLYHYEPKPGKSLLAMFKAPICYAYPDLRLPAINDGWFNAFPPGDLYEVAYRQSGDPDLAWMTANGYQAGTSLAGCPTWDYNDGHRNSLYALLFGEPLPDKLPEPARHSADYPGLGISVLRSPGDRSVLTFHYGRFLGHGHPDKMSVTLFSHGKLWAADYGTPGYGSQILQWYKSTLAHNTIVVDGKGQAHTTEGDAIRWLGDPLLEAVESETTQAYPGVSFRRLVIRVGDYFVIRDRLESKENHTYDFYLHSEGELTLTQSGKPAPAESPSPWITELAAWPKADMISGSWEHGSYALDLWMDGSTSIRPLVGRCPAESGLQTVPLLIARQYGQSAEFVTVLYPRRGSHAPRISRQGDTLTISSGRFEDTLVLPRAGERPVVTRKPASP